ncbi:hypothetical protein P3X46_005569 [Hevea brasiliensis]|uniref:Uncharacterized protein n=1 Tax=Hevea brasiliensis TaxID=3981 RepID=A0ABQ9N0Z2_HEVBR|nr:uncharacterized protein LOC110635962 [Hevea brasiliensis]KAJ9186011.1 hypothetical protein P3X46_005569 [Hevea brasiliensis]
MKKVIPILFVLGLGLLYLQVDARRLVLEQIKTQKTENQLQSNAPGIKPNDEHGKSSTSGNPLTGSVPAVEADTDNRNSSTSTSSGGSNSSGDGDDEKNTSYGNYGYPSGSSTETHHAYTNDCNPKKGC